MTWGPIGAPLAAVRVTAAAYGEESGEPRIYAVSQGSTSTLYVIDMKAARCLRSFRLEGSSHCWGVCIAGDGRVYMGGDGDLYRYDPETESVENCGRAIEGETYFWRLAADGKGRVYGGTYPGGKVFQYDPASGTFRDYGSMVPGEQYARSLDAGPNGKLYVGVGAKKAAVVELDTDTGDKRLLPVPEGHENSGMVYDLDVYDGKLFARFTDPLTLWVYDLAAEAWVRKVERAMGLDVSPPYGRKVYLLRDGRLQAMDLDSLDLVPTSFEYETHVYDFGWMTWDAPGFPGKSLVSMHSAGFFVFNPTTGRSERIEVELPGAPVDVQSLTAGADGNIYIGGYFAGGFSAYDPRTNAFLPCKPFGQSEQLCYFRDNVYMGVYPGAFLHRFDPKLPWAPGENPRVVFSLKKEGQDRPFAITGAGDKLAVGTVPTYGKLGGALALYDPESDAYELYPEPVAGQSVIALAYADGFLYGGTSVYGGLGGTPTETDGKLFVWDMETKRTVWEGVPVPGEKVVSAVVVGEGGRVWGMTSGHLFAFDRDSRRIERVTELFPPIDWASRTHFWRGVFLQYESGGTLYGNCVDKLFRYDIGAERLDVLAEGAILFARDERGSLYAADGETLYKYSFDD